MTKPSHYRKQRLWLLSGGYYPHAVLLRKGEIYNLTGRWDQADRIYASCLHRAELSEDGRVLAECLSGKAALRYIQGRYPETLDLYRRLLAVYEDSGEQMALDRMQLSLGSLYARMSDMEKARECYQRAIRMAEASGDDSLKMRVHLNMGMMHIHKNEFAEAEGECREALELALKTGDPKAEYNARINLGIACRETGHLDEAMECAVKAMDFAKKIGEKRGYGMALDNAGQIWQKRGEIDKAITCFGEYLTLAESMNDRNNQAVASNNLAGALMEKGELAAAEKNYCAALEIMKELGNIFYQADSLFHIAQVRRAAGDMKGTREYLNRAISLGETIQSNPYLEKYRGFQKELS